MSALDLQEMFRNVLGLVGREVEVGVASSGERLSGRVANAMFDSFLLDTAGKMRVVRFDDILFLDEGSRPAA